MAAENLQASGEALQGFLKLLREEDLQTLKARFLSKDNEKLYSLRSFIEKRYRKIPGFFSPIKSTTDLGLTLAAPFVLPIALPIISGLLTAAATILGVVCVGSLLAMPVTTAEHRNAAFNLAAISGALSLACAAGASLAALAAAVASPIAFIYLITRGLTTLVKPKEPGYVAIELYDEDLKVSSSSSSSSP